MIDPCDTVNVLPEDDEAEMSARELSGMCIALTVMMAPLPIVLLPCFVEGEEDWVHSTEARIEIAKAEAEAAEDDLVPYDDVEALLRELKS